MVQAGEWLIAPAVSSYERSHAAIDYSARATRNDVARLQDRKGANADAPSAHAQRGYLDALLSELQIDAASQVLVFSKTSLQAAHISSQKPRAIYFNDSTYVGWVQDSDHLEVLSIDDDRGPVFFMVRNAPPQPLQFKRESALCMACHDSAALQTGGVPLVLVRSSRVEGEMSPAGRVVPAEVTHATALEDRWGGWYVTGRLGVQLHLGNMPLAGPPDPTVRHINNRVNLDSLSSYIDTTPYTSDTSDVVALLVLEHQSYVHNLITRAKYTIASRQGAPKSEATWNSFSNEQRRTLRAELLALARAMTFQDERRLLNRIRGNGKFERGFEVAGPSDSQGRSLRQFELATRMFKYPMSYLVYSSAFQSLPAFAREYVYEHFAVLARSESGHPQLDEDRAAAAAILAETLTDFRAHWVNPVAVQQARGAVATNGPVALQK